MANTQATFGFQHFGYISGGNPDYQQNKGLIQSTFSTKIFFGDPVIKSAASPYMTLAVGTTTAVWGIFVGCQYTPTGQPPQWSPFWPGAAAADATGYVIDAPNALFKVAALLTAVPATAIGANITFTTGGLSGTTVGGGFSVYTVDQATLTASTAYPFQIYSMYPGLGNGSDTTTSYNWVIVGFNNQRYHTLTGTM